MNRLITPGGTFFAKFLMPPLWLGFLVFWTYGFYDHPKKPNALPGWFVLILLTMAVGGMNCFVRYHLPLKKVWIVNGGLRVSDYRRTIDLPFSAIEEITQLHQINLRYIVVRLRWDTVFGRRFTMLPIHPKIFPFAWGEDAIVVELRKLAKLGLGRGGVED